MTKKNETVTKEKKRKTVTRSNVGGVKSKTVVKAKRNESLVTKTKSKKKIGDTKIREKSKTLNRLGDTYKTGKKVTKRKKAVHEPIKTVEKTGYSNRPTLGSTTRGSITTKKYAKGHNIKRTKKVSGGQDGSYISPSAGMKFDKRGRAKKSVSGNSLTTRRRR